MAKMKMNIKKKKKKKKRDKRKPINIFLIIRKSVPFLDVQKEGLQHFIRDEWELGIIKKLRTGW
eukprot:10470018-Ditylum_brightwellii.AAC.1